jgi:GTP-binding protein
VINKIDKLSYGAAEELAERIAHAIDYKGPMFAVSAMTGEGTDELVRAIAEFLERQAQARKEAMEHLKAAGRVSD